jgi:8-oxo-dGTP pyrophosphatase MutT (NUDIX family)
MREVHEETGLTVAVGPLALVNEFHDPAPGFHQVDLNFRCHMPAGVRAAAGRDPARVVTRRQFFSRGELAAIRYKPDSLAEVAFGPPGVAQYDPLEVIVR